MQLYYSIYYQICQVFLKKILKKDFGLIHENASVRNPVKNYKKELKISKISQRLL